MPEEKKKVNTKRLAVDVKTKAELVRHWQAMLDSTLTLRIYCHRNRLTLDSFVKGMRKWLPQEWEAKKNGIGPIPEKSCRACTLPFYPRTSRQQYCCQACRDKGWHSANPHYRINKNEKRSE